MLHGRAMRPAGAGAPLVSVDESSVKAIPGYMKTVVNGNFVGVVAENEWAAMRAARELNVKWTSPAVSLPEDLYRHMRSVKPKATRELVNQGDSAAALAR